MNELSSPAEAANALIEEICALEDPSTQNQRAVRKRFSRELKNAPAQFVIDMGIRLFEDHGRRWHACEIVAAHPDGVASLDAATLERFGAGIDSWDNVDVFARTLSGPAWLRGAIGDDVIHRWARSEDLWWRRAALVSTVALNMKVDGGAGDLAKTLAVCDMLLDDREDMVMKAMSWALRALSTPEPEAVAAYVDANEDRLAARAKREVRNKLRTGLKNAPRRKG